MSVQCCVCFVGFHVTRVGDFVGCICSTGLCGMIVI